MEKLIILDFFLTDNKGHHEQYDFSVAEEALQEGIKTEIWCPARAGSQPQFVKQYLKSPSRIKNPLIWALITFATRISELGSFFRREEIDKSTIVLIPCTDSHFLLSLYLGTIGVNVDAKVIVVLRRGLSEHWMPLGYLTRKIISVINDPFMSYLYYKKNVYFCSDSDLITQELLTRGFNKTATLPIPHVPAKKERSADKNTTVISCFGGACYEKGFDLVPELIRVLIEKKEKVFFIIQNFFRQTSRIDLMTKAMRDIGELQKIYSDKLLVIDKYLSDSEYSDYMKRSSIVLIPYRKEFYGKGTSGILAEAIACEAWAIVPSGTWMAAQKEKYDKIVIFDDLTVTSLVDAITYCISNENSINDGHVKKQIDEWCSFHSPVNYLKSLMSF